MYRPSERQTSVNDKVPHLSVLGLLVAIFILLLLVLFFPTLFHHMRPLKSTGILLKITFKTLYMLYHNKCI